MTRNPQECGRKTRPTSRHAHWTGALATSFPPIDARDFAALLDAIDRAETAGGDCPVDPSKGMAKERSSALA